MSNTITKDRLAELLAKARAQKISQTTSIIEVNQNQTTESNSVFTDHYGNTITYNKEQQEFISLALQNKSCVLIGAAGTGKTTCTKGAVISLIQSGISGILKSEGHKYLPQDGVPGIVATSFTRRAVSNLRKNLPPDIKHNCITLHKLLEYEPKIYSVYDPESGKDKTTMRFIPTRNFLRPLPETIKVVILDESSMISTDLFKQLVEALPHNPMYIFLGDIQQLPPIFGPAILGYKMLELSTVELTQVYRQALNSPIIELATQIKSGETLVLKEKFVKETSKGKLTIHPWKKSLHAETALFTVAKFITLALDSGAYNPDEDMILIPFNKSLGTIELNKHIANHIARKNSRVTWEVIAGFNKHYFSIGDHVLYDKEDATIISIETNPNFSSKKPQKESPYLDYWGHKQTESGESIYEESDNSEIDPDFLLQQISFSSDSEEKINKASHIITVKLDDTEQEAMLDTAAEINSLLLAYSLTVHKAQGSEWRKVFLILHQSHNTMLQRELLYTAVTRAREELYIICEPDSFERGVISQKIKGDTLAEKAEYFKGKI